MQVAYATGDELRILRAEVEDQHLLRGPLGCILGHEPPNRAAIIDGETC